MNAAKATLSKVQQSLKLTTTTPSTAALVFAKIPLIVMLFNSRPTMIVPQTP